RRDRRSLPLQLADDFAPPRRAARRRPRRHRAERAGDPLRAEHVGLPGSGPASRRLDQAVLAGGARAAPRTGGVAMTDKRQMHAPAIVALAIGYFVGLLAYPKLPGPFLTETPWARLLVAFTLPTTALVIYALFRSLWNHDRVRSGNGAFEITY